jgi:uncharacterized protein (DUF4415 family)
MIKDVIMGYSLWIFFQRLGKGYQTRMNAALRAYVSARLKDERV